VTQDEHDKTADEIRGRLQEIGRSVKGELPKDWAFLLLVAPIGEVKGVTLYLSTMQRADALQVMREFIATQREERNWFQEVKTDSLTVEDFDQWWEQQLKRGMENWTLKQACKEAFDGGKAAA
jgi:hypothetical protein